ncbi:MAG: hypothetical protein GXN93_04695, partial [Candidatus Diapherotrites archaeon]|nr:hypothetical protein [Candidatus Diapherotrites archaeon]
MWPWKKRKDNKKDDNRDTPPKEPDPNEIMRKQMEAELDRMFPGMGRMWREI